MLSVQVVENFVVKRRIARIAVLALTVCVGCCVLGTAAARASFELVKPFGGGPLSEGGSLSSQNVTVAVDEHTGDLYAFDSANYRVMRFNAHGKFLDAWGWGVGDGKKEFEHCGPEGELILPECHGNGDFQSGQEDWGGVPGEGPGQFQIAAKGIAVDQATGDVFVVSHHVVGDVQVFSPSGELLTSFANKGPGEEEIEEATAIATDPAGDVYLESEGGPRGFRLLEFVKNSPTNYVFSHEVRLTGVAHQTAEAEFVDFANNGSLFVASATRIHRLEPPDFTTVGWEHSLTSAQAVSINPATNEVFYSGKQGKFHEFKPRGTNELENQADEVGKEELFPDQEHQRENTMAVVDDPAGQEAGHGVGIFYAVLESDALQDEVHEPTHLLLYAPPGGVGGEETPPVIEGEGVAGVGTTSVELTANVNDENFAGQYEFEYGIAPCASGGCVVTAPATLPPVKGAQSVSATIAGLQPGTAYYFRVTVTTHCESAEPTKECVVNGKGETFKTFAAKEEGGGEGEGGVGEAGASTGSELLDGRVYELVSPADKDGGEAFPLDPDFTSCPKVCEPGNRSSRQVIESTSDGSAVSYDGWPFASGGDGVNENEYRSYRTPTGWRTVDLTPALVAPREPGYQALSSDLQEGVLALLKNPLSAEAPAKGAELYLRQSDGTLQPLLTTSTVDYGALENPLALNYEGASQGLSPIVFGANDPLTAQTGEAPAAPKVSAGQFDLYAWAKGALTLVSVLPGNTTALAGAVLGRQKEAFGVGGGSIGATGAVSSNGSRIFFSDAVTGQVYLRLNGAETLEFPDSAGKFVAADSDGSTVLLSDGKMFRVSEAGITPTVDLSNGQGGFLGVLGTSQTLSRVYFVDTAKLTNEEGPRHTVAKAGEDNLYAYSEGETRFIATLPERDGGFTTLDAMGDWKVSLSDRTAQVTTDGGYLAFMSSADLTGSANDGFQVFEYDWDPGTLVCVSCNRSGVNPVGESRLSVLHPLGNEWPSPQPRNLTANGRVFFESFDVLTPGDHAPGVKNVYEYERDGQGSCEEVEGCVALISSGRGEADSSFLAADETGANVFFTTRERLVPEDEDELIDVYDAREGGGFPHPGSPEACHAEACMPVSVPLPPLAPLTDRTQPAGGASMPPSPSVIARLTGLHASFKDGRLHLMLTASSAGTVKVTGRLTRGVVAKVAAGRHEGVVVPVTRAGLRALEQHRTIVLTVTIQMGSTHIVRKVKVSCGPCSR